MTDIEYREVQVREVNTETREITGLAVPYGEAIDIGGYSERFERGAFGDSSSGPLFYGHDHRNGGTPIGRIVEGRDTDEGFLVRAKISDTPKGNEVYTLLRDGVIDTFSVGFEPVESRMDGDVVVRTAARLKEVSVTPFPAYAGAKISEVRSEVIDNTKEDVVTDANQNDADLIEIRDTVTDLERKIAVLSDRDEAPAGSQFRDAGSLLKALATGDEKARAEFRAADAVAPATSAQSGANAQNSWLSRPMRLVQENRQVINLFAKAPLPDFGNTVEYPVVASTAGTVEKQVNEGDALAYMEVELGTGTATVGTYGGYSSLTRQAIERGDAAYLNKVLEYQALQYAKATEAAARAILSGATGTGAVTLGGGVSHTAADAQDWIDFVIDSAAAIEDDSLGLTADFVIVSRDVFKSIARLVDTTGRPIFALKDGATNTVGEANLVKAGANIGGLPVVVGPKFGVNTAVVASKDAVTTLESAGAPFRLQDENIVNLTKDFSLYGYAAWTVNDAKGLVKGDVDGVL